MEMEIANLIKRNKLLLLILAITLLKGLIWAFITPAFQTPDEHRHYATIQHYAEPENYSPVIKKRTGKLFSFFDISTHNLSPELRNILDRTEFENTCFDYNGKNYFSKSSSLGPNEKQIRSLKLNRFVERYPPTNVSYTSSYYKMGSIIENYLANKNINIIERANVIRILSVLIAVFLVFASYLIFRELSFNPTESSLLAGAVSFQPMFSFMGSVINPDIVLFLAFTIFILGAMKTLRRGLNFQNAFLIFTGTALAIHAKPPGYFLLLGVLLLVILYILQSRKNRLFLSPLFVKKHTYSSLLVAISAILMLCLAFNKFLSYKFNFVSLEKLKNYILYQFQLPISIDRSATYWGNFGSPNVPISNYYIFFIWFILLVSLIGLLLFARKLFQKFREKNQEKQTLFFQILFLLFIVVGLNLLIHFVNIQGANPKDFGDFYASIGSPGRYFLPAICAKFALIAFGLSYFFKKANREKILFCLLIAMIAFNMTAIFNFIIPRYYL